MNLDNSRLITPIYLKESDDGPLPEDHVYYILSRDGLRLCRNERFFRSAVPARRPPSELAPQPTFLQVNFPQIPRSLLEQAVGFFDWAYLERGAEAVLLLGWNEVHRRVEFIAPEQTADSFCNWKGDVYPETVKYQVPHPLPPGFLLFGDLHSHGDMNAYASGIDQQDDAQFNGLHLVVGRLQEEPPQWHLEASVDGTRFQIQSEMIFAGYQQRREDFPDAWRASHSVQYRGHTGHAPTPVYDTKSDSPSTAAHLDGPNRGVATTGEA